MQDTATPTLSLRRAQGACRLALGGLLSLGATAAMPVNNNPIITAIPDQVIVEDKASLAIPFVIGDTETPAVLLSLEAITSNPTLIPLSGIVFSGKGAQRSLKLKPAPNQFGTTTIQVRVTDLDGGTSAVSFNLTVSSVNDAPTISVIPDQSLDVNQSSQPIPFTIADAETPAQDLTLTTTCSNKALLPDLRLGGSGSTRTLTLYPAAKKSGTATVHVYVTDAEGARKASTFQVTVASPTIPATIGSFTTCCPVVEYSQAATLSWTVKGTLTSATLNGENVLGLTSTQVHPRNVQTYTLVVSNAYGSDTRTLSVAARGQDLLAGDADGAGYRDGTLQTARFGTNKIGLVQDSRGNLYTTDQTAIRKVSSNGVVSTLAGSTMAGYADGSALQARFAGINGLALDEAAGWLYAADVDNRAIRVVDLTTGTVSTLLGKPGLSRPTGNWGDVTQIAPGTPLAGIGLNGAYQLALDPVRHRLYITETWMGSADILVIDLIKNTIETYAGNGYADWTSRTNCARLDARFTAPWGLTLDPSGNLYVHDTSAGKIVRIDAQTGWTTDVCTTGFLYCLGWNAKTNRLVLSPSLQIGYSYPVLLEVDVTTGLTSFVAGGSLSNIQDGVGANAGLFSGQGLSVNANGIAYFGDGTSLRSANLSTGQVATLTGYTPARTPLDGVGAQARFNTPSSPTYDAAGNLYVADVHCIRKVSPAGAVTTLAGSFTETGSVDGTGSAARFTSILSLASDAAGNLCALDQTSVDYYTSPVIRMITPQGVVSTLPLTQGTGDLPPADGVAAQARIGRIQKLVCDNGGNVYFWDQFNLYSSDWMHSYSGSALRLLTPSGSITTLAGSLNIINHTQDGTGSTAGFGNIRGIVVNNGQLFFTGTSPDTSADPNAVVLRVLDLNTHAVQTVSKAHTLGECPMASVDGTLSDTARFDTIDVLAVDEPTGDILLASPWHSTLRRIHAGQVTTLRTFGVNDPAPASAAAIASPTGLAVSPTGNVVFTTNAGVVQITAP